MRIERSGLIERLTPTVEKFLREALRGVSLDETHSAEETRIDFSCLSGLIAIEIKSLEGDPAERTNNYIDSLRDRPDFPTFFGSVPLEAAFANMQDSEKLRHGAIDRLGRTIVNHMKKANEQLRQHNSDYPRQNRLNLVLLINEDHPEYDPMSIGWIVTREFSKEDTRGPRYAEIDAILYLTERHGVAVEGLVSFPITSIHNRTIDIQLWKETLLEFFIQRWASWNGRPLFVSDPANAAEFEAFDHVPEKMPRHEAWRLAYRRNPHFKDLSDDELRDEFDDVMMITSLWGLKGSPIKLDMEAGMTAMERFTHIQVEMHNRAIPMERFNYEFERELAAATRLKLPQSVIAWLHELQNDRSG